VPAHHLAGQSNEQREELKLLSEMVTECQEHYSSVRDLPSKVEQFTTVFNAGLKEVQAKVLTKLQKLDEFSDMFDTGLKKMQGRVETASAACPIPSEDRTTMLEENCGHILKDVANLYEILSALDSSQLNEVQHQLQRERQERQSETEVLRSSLQRLEAEVSRPSQDVRRGFKTQDERSGRRVEIPYAGGSLRNSPAGSLRTSLVKRPNEIQSHRELGIAGMVMPVEMNGSSLQHGHDAPTVVRRSGDFRSASPPVSVIRHGVVSPSNPQTGGGSLHMPPVSQSVRIISRSPSPLCQAQEIHQC
jgi:hypothetical protein